jgi:TetR/AcrR family transcriptional regulator
MSNGPVKVSRRQQILECLASMLEENPGERITTATLAKMVGVSEAALYRHFPSKSKMFEGLIEFIESTIFTRITIILADEKLALKRCELIMQLLLAFAERNPGITRILTGDALTGETARLRARIVQFFDRIETQLKQVLREGELREELHVSINTTAAANFMLAFVDGRMLQFVRTEFKRKPMENWSEQWLLIANNFLNRSI